MACSPTRQLSEGCNVTLEMKGQVQRKKLTSLSELIKGAVLLGFTPSASRITLDIPVPQSTLSDNEMTLPLSWFQLRSQHCLGDGSKVLLLPLFTHIFS